MDEILHTTPGIEGVVAVRKDEFLELCNMRPARGGSYYEWLTHCGVWVHAISLATTREEKVTCEACVLLRFAEDAASKETE